MYLLIIDSTMFRLKKALYFKFSTLDQLKCAEIILKTAFKHNSHYKEAYPNF